MHAGTRATPTTINDVQNITQATNDQGATSLHVHDVRMLGNPPTTSIEIQEPNMYPQDATGPLLLLATQDDHDRATQYKLHVWDMTTGSHVPLATDDAYHPHRWNKCTTLSDDGRHVCEVRCDGYVHGWTNAAGRLESTGRMALGKDDEESLCCVDVADSVLVAGGWYREVWFATFGE